MSELKEELERIYELAGGVNWVRDPQDLLYAIIGRVDAGYFTRNDRASIEELLTPVFKAQAQTLHKFIGTSNLPGCLKMRICGAVEFYLRNTCSMGVAEMKQFKSGCVFDPATYNLFEGLEGD